MLRSSISWRTWLKPALLTRSRRNGTFRAIFRSRIGEIDFSGACLFQQIYQFCTSYGGLIWLALASDLSVALAYFALPVTMAVVLRQRKDDIPYPWLWTLFVIFIVACGLTHIVHVWSAFTGAEYLGAQVIIGLVTAAASVGNTTRSPTLGFLRDRGPLQPPVRRALIRDPARSSWQAGG